VKKASAAMQEQLMFVYLIEWLLKCEGQSPAPAQTNKHEQENLDVEQEIRFALQNPTPYINAIHCSLSQ
jgi:hypothetical protein